MFTCCHWENKRSGGQLSVEIIEQHKCGLYEVWGNIGCRDPQNDETLCFGSFHTYEKARDFAYFEVGAEQCRVEDDEPDYLTVDNGRIV
jgi:hypothetical protein